MRLRPWIYTWALLLAASCTAHAHGILYGITNKEAVVVAAEYDDGEPASYARIKVTSPKGESIEHQNGRTDKNGCFAFLPDFPGPWKIVIDDGMGHRIDAELLVGEALAIQEKRGSVRACSRWPGVVTGLSLVFGIFGFAMYFRTRKLYRHVLLHK